MDNKAIASISADNAVRLSMKAGELMLKSGAETNRVEDTMERILRKCGYPDADTFVTQTGLFAGATDGDGQLHTAVGRVKSRSNNLNLVVMVNELSRDFAEGRISAACMDEGLDKADKAPVPYSKWIIVVGCAAACGTFSVLLDGSVRDGITAFIIGVFIQMFLLKSIKLNALLTTIIGGGLIGLLSLSLLNIGLGENLEKIIVGAIMPLLPGVAFTNAIRDVLAGDYLSGTARLADAVIVAIGIATGVGTVLSMWIELFGGVLIR